MSSNDLQKENNLIVCKTDKGIGTNPKRQW